MGTFDKKYIIYQASRDDIDEIMLFIRDEWKKNHILSRDRDIFEHEFLNEDNSLNMIVARRREGNTIEGIMGYIFSSNTVDKRDIWGSMWKVRGGNEGLLGLELFKKIEKVSGCRYHLGVGANPQTAVPMVRMFLKRNVGKMEHYYRLNKELAGRFNLAVANNFVVSEYDACETIDFERLVNLEDVSEQFWNVIVEDRIPYKDSWYVTNRYINHPVYKYNLYTLSENGEVKGVIVLRVQEHNGSRAIRVIDYIGDMAYIRYTGMLWDSIMREYTAEYVDMYVLGVDDTLLKYAGFEKLCETEDVVIPNYFYPYEQKNVDIWVYNSFPEALFFKGDGDQDRAN